MQQNLRHFANANQMPIGNQVRTGNNNEQPYRYGANTTPYPIHQISTSKPGQTKNYQPASISSQYQPSNYQNYYRPTPQQNSYRQAQYPYDPQSAQQSGNQYYNRQALSGSNQVFGTLTPWPAAIPTASASSSSNQIRQTLTQLAKLTNSEHDRNIINLILRVLPTNQLGSSTQSPLLISFIKQFLSTINPGGTKKPSFPGSSSIGGSSGSKIFSNISSVQVFNTSSIN